jgi:hypothetical protein
MELLESHLDVQSEEFSGTPRITGRSPRISVAASPR